MNKKPPIWTMRLSLGFTALLGLTCIICLIMDKKDLTVSIGAVALFFAVIGIGAMTLCDLRQRPPQS